MVIFVIFLASYQYHIKLNVVFLTSSKGSDSSPTSSSSFQFWKSTLSQCCLAFSLSSLSHPVAFNDQETLEPELLDTMRRCLEKNPSRRATVNQSCKMSKLIRYMHWVQIMRTTRLNSKIFTQLTLIIRSGNFATLQLRSC